MHMHAKTFKNRAVASGLINAMIKFPGFGMGSVSLYTIDICGWIILCTGDCPVPCGVVRAALDSTQ